MKQTALYKTAVIVHFLQSVASVFLALPALLTGAGSGSAEGVPQFVIVIAALLAVAGIVSAYGAWQGERWGIWITIVVEALNGLLALPGLLFAPTAAAQASAAAGVLIALFVIFGLLRRPRLIAQ